MWAASGFTLTFPRNADPRVQQAIGQVGEEVGEHNCRGQYQDGALDGGVIAHDDRGEEVVPEAPVDEDFFDDDAAAEHETDADAQLGEQGQRAFRPT